MDTTYPAGAAGTLLANGTILSGDDAPAFTAAGFTVRPCCVRCSERIADGRDAMPEDYQLCAIDQNGLASWEIGELVGKALGREESYWQATGIYDGQELPTTLVQLAPSELVTVHDYLLENLPGFGCFAVLERIR